MTSHNRLIATAIGLTLAAGTAQAGPARAHGSTTAAAQETLALKLEVEALKAQVAALAARLDAQVQAQERTQSQAQTAQATAQTAQTTAQSVASQAAAGQDQIKTLPAQVAAATKAAASRPGWWGDTKIGGSFFADISSISNRNAAGKTAQSGTNYDIRRAYFIVEHKFDNTYSFNFTTDFNYDSGPAAATQLFIKKAYLQAHYADAFNVRLGAAELPWIPFIENLNGYRYVGQMLIDRTRFGVTTDWGVHIFGTLADKIISYQVSVIDGEGFKKPAVGTANRTNAVDMEGRISASYRHFTVGVGGYDGKLGAAVEGVATYNSARRFDAVAAYTDSKARLGIEYVYAKYWGDVTQANPAKTNHTEGYSIFGSYNVAPKWSVFGRYDWVKPKAVTVPSEHDNYFDAGIAYKPIPALDFALVYKREDVTDGSLSTTDAVIGIPAGAITGKGTYDEVGLFTQVKF